MTYAASVLDRRSLEELREKYATMLAMRRRHASGDEDATEARRDMVRLAARYPGALREIDELTSGEIERRIRALDGTIAAEREAEPWMAVLARFHQLARGALCAKRWLAGRKTIDEEIERAYRQALPSLAFPDDADAWATELRWIAAPPRGRITHAVFAKLGTELGITDGAARRLAFGVSRSERGERGK